LISAWRITKQKHVRTAFTGEGAKQYGGRWNSPGKPAIYTAESRAVALAEILVHLESAAVLPRYVVLRVEIDEANIAHLDPHDLPRNWRAEPAPRRLQTLGDEWLDSGKAAVLRVPSAIVVGEFNYLLNPLHPDFSMLRIHSPEKFSIDRRFVMQRAARL
jgi:RES domain-containing protein